MDVPDRWYHVDIVDIASGDIRRTPMWAPWAGEGSLAMYREKMCDCNLFGFRERGWQTQQGWHWSDSPHELLTAVYRDRFGPCDHSMPPKRYRAVRVYL